MSPTRGIDETVNFQNFCKFFTYKCAVFFEHFGTLFSSGKKRNDVAGHMKHAAMAVS